MSASLAKLLDRQYTAQELQSLFPATGAEVSPSQPPITAQSTQPSSDDAAVDIALFCVECEDQPARLFCHPCADSYCEVCFQALHRKGHRRRHRVTLAPNVPGSSVVSAADPMQVSSPSPSPLHMAAASGTTSEPSEASGTGYDTSVLAATDAVCMTAEEILAMTDSVPVVTPGEGYDQMDTRVQWIPIRLSLAERKILRLLEAALNVSEYTDKIDILSSRSGPSKPHRIVAQIKDLCAILCGLVVASDYQTGQELIQDKDYKYNEKYFRRVFEIGRRHKVMNPEKMRSTYGKLVYLLMDSQLSEVQDMLEFSCVSSILTVQSVLQGSHAESMLRDPLVYIATREIIPDGKSRYVIQKEIKQKEKAIETLVRRYTSREVSEEKLRTCLYSIADNNSFLRGNRDPIDKMIDLLQLHFSPTATEPPFSLSISSGNGGARLSHTHERQYYYVLQSMTLWREINHNMFKLWCLADQDLLDASNTYRLRDTGQGLNRLQDCPRIGREIRLILSQVQRKVGSNHWVGSSVVHLGDTNVPNALMFMEAIDLRLVKDPAILKYINSSFSSPLHLKKAILTDFFRHGFDGSGADNFYDAGSCIDGRLTSAWNWCHSIEKKPWFPIFLLAGFTGFDGEFQ